MQALVEALQLSMLSFGAWRDIGSQTSNAQRKTGPELQALTEGLQLSMWGYGHGATSPHRRQMLAQLLALAAGTDQALHLTMRAFIAWRGCSTISVVR